MDLDWSHWPGLAVAFTLTSRLGESMIFFVSCIRKLYITGRCLMLHAIPYLANRLHI